MQVRSISLLLFILCQALAISIWPNVENVQLAESRAILYPDQLHFSLQKPTGDILIKGVERYAQLFFPYPFQVQQNQKNNEKILVEIEINTSEASEELTFGIDESYHITTSTINNNQYKLILSATNCFGVLRGLETLSQLIEMEQRTTEDGEDYYIYFINGLPLAIDDQPKYPWRGLLFDTARHFAPKEELYHLLDAMSYAKFNVLHWHLTDEQSFPVETFTFPDLKKGSWNHNAIYTQEDIQDVIDYALYRGIRVVPEIDLPGHCKSWGEGYPDVITRFALLLSIFNLQWCIYLLFIAALH